MRRECASKFRRGWHHGRRVGFFRKLLCWALVLGAAATTALRADEAASRIVIVANSDDPDSLRLAHYYAAKRAVPEKNIFAFKMPLAETITWPEFVGSVWQPLEDELVRQGWIDAIGMTLTDAVGRKTYVTNGHRISYLVVCRGVPLRISHDPALYQEQAPTTLRPEFRTNQAAVDSELALLAQVRPPINAFVSNPLYRNDHPSVAELRQVIRVSRLDGPSYDDARALVDHALEAERTGLLGRAYVDLGGIHPEGDRWLESTAKQLTALGFDLEVDRAPTTLPVTARFDAPVLYFGWYANDLNGPFALPGFHFPPGAIAVHIHSYSARTLRSATEAWTGPLVARGVTATVGNVFEPYLELTHDPSLLLHALAQGMTFGEAAAYAIPALSWQGVAIGDPLYRPFAVPLAAQLEHLAQLPPPLAAYAILRQAHLLEADGKSDEALALLRGAAREHPGLALAMALASRLEAAGDLAGAAQSLAVAPLMTAFQPGEWALAHQVAQRLVADGAAGKAVMVYQHLFADAAVPTVLRLSWLGDARQAALSAQDAAQAAEWDKETAPGGKK
jgi:uncharacterized protein (TIGR03790 family)